jgi:hypothetical protein
MIYFVRQGHIHDTIMLVHMIYYPSITHKEEANWPKPHWAYVYYQVSVGIFVVWDIFYVYFRMIPFHNGGCK